MINAGTRKVRYPRNFHFEFKVPKAFNAFCFVWRPMAMSVVSNTNPKDSTSAR